MSLTMVMCLLVLYKTSGLTNGLHVSVAQSKLSVLKETAGNYCCLAQTWYFIAVGPAWRYYGESKAIVELIIINNTKSTHGSSTPDEDFSYDTKSIMICVGVVLLLLLLIVITIVGFKLWFYKKHHRDKQVSKQTTCQADEDNQDNINYAELDMHVLGRCQKAPKVTVSQESSGLYARVYEKPHTGAHC
uniref:Uncharacterized protein LOC116948769 isoform X2 n=1 Tax=Petromyzon marinus TaxID=7757 RepID=A0AAJ7TSA4_PETMA|nr:uncharacterized protein LOC116948769 isoform X2 [Petromyzon marinus]